MNRLYPARVVEISRDTEPEVILDLLALDSLPQAVISISGGASDFPQGVFTEVHKLMHVVVDLSFDKQIMLVDGGTQKGVMEITGKIFFEHVRRKNYKGSYPALIGFVPKSKIESPELGYHTCDPDPGKLESNHPYFVLVQDAQEWGDEIGRMFAVVDHLEKIVPTIAIVANGGFLTLREVDHSIDSGREIIVFEGSLRAAEAIVAAKRGASEDGLVRILLKEDGAIKPVVSQNERPLEENLQEAMRLLKKVADYNKITLFNLNGSSSELRSLILKKMNLT